MSEAFQEPHTLICPSLQPLSLCGYNSEEPPRAVVSRTYGMVTQKGAKNSRRDMVRSLLAYFDGEKVYTLEHGRAKLHHWLYFEPPSSHFFSWSSAHFTFRLFCTPPCPRVGVWGPARPPIYRIRTLTHAHTTSPRTSQNVDPALMGFVAGILATLPYTVEDEPLYLVDAIEGMAAGNICVLEVLAC